VPINGVQELESERFNASTLQVPIFPESSSSLFFSKPCFRESCKMKLAKKEGIQICRFPHGLSETGRVPSRLFDFAYRAFHKCPS
jgi:hypothetical protein